MTLSGIGPAGSERFALRAHLRTVHGHPCVPGERRRAGAERQRSLPAAVGRSSFGETDDHRSDVLLAAWRRRRHAGGNSRKSARGRRCACCSLLDAFGSQHLSREYVHTRCATPASRWRELRRASTGITIHDASDRSHVRVVVVDGRIGYTGGFGLADYWLGDGHHEDQWRESNVRFAGPAVMELQAAFAAAWAEVDGRADHRSALLPRGGLSGRRHDARGAALHRADDGAARRPSDFSRSRSAARARRCTSRTRTSCRTTIFDGCSSARRAAAWTSAC